MLVLRKFLIGQSSLIVNQSERMAQLSLSSRRVFDDIFLHIKKVGRNENIQTLAELQMELTNH
jgi:hypothetical protein